MEKRVRPKSNKLNTRKRGNDTRYSFTLAMEEQLPKMTAQDTNAKERGEYYKRRKTLLLEAFAKQDISHITYAQSKKNPTPFLWTTNFFVFL